MSLGTSWTKKKTHAVLHHTKKEALLLCTSTYVRTYDKTLAAAA